MKFTINPKSAAISLTIIVILLIVANIGVQVLKFAFGHEYIFGLYRVFDFNSEGNIPTFYSAVALLISAALLAAIARHKYTDGDQFKVHWAALSGIFVFLAIDESSQLHELIVKNLQPTLDLPGIFFFVWVIPYGILTILFATMYLRFWLALPAKTRRLFMYSAFIFLLGAVGFEMISSAVVSSLGGWESYYHLYHVILYSIEEPLEMIGIVIFIFAILDYVAKYRSPTSVVFSYD